MAPLNEESFTPEPVSAVKTSPVAGLPETLPVDPFRVIEVERAV